MITQQLITDVLTEKVNLGEINFPDYTKNNLIWRLSMNKSIANWIQDNEDKTTYLLLFIMDNNLGVVSNLNLSCYIEYKMLFTGGNNDWEYLIFELQGSDLLRYLRDKKIDQVINE
jgi:hypothetical protein